MIKDILYYKNHRLVFSFDKYWYSESFNETFKKLIDAKKHIDGL